MREIQIRKATSEDAQAILDIYKPYVENSAITFEYEVPSVEEFKGRIKTISKEYPYYVAVEKGVLIGYAYASTLKDRSAYQWSCEVSVYLAKQAQGKQIGKRLYDLLEQQLLKLGIHNIYACITYPNEASIRFHEKQGFETIAHFHKCGYKLNAWWDMIWMEKMIQEHKDAPNVWKKEK